MDAVSQLNRYLQNLGYLNPAVAIEEERHHLCETPQLWCLIVRAISATPPPRRPRFAPLLPSLRRR